MKGSTLLQEGIQNWKLRLILSAILCVIGLSILVSMVLGLFIQLSVADKSIVSIAIFMVGTPTYLITSKLAKVDQYTIAGFLNTHIDEVGGNAEVLVKDTSEMDDAERKTRERLEEFFSENPLYNFLPDKPVKQAYLLFLFSLLCSFGIWYLS